MVGIYRNWCNALYCIEEVKCCQLSYSLLETDNSSTVAEKGALVQEEDELEAEGEGGSNLGFWRRRRRRDPRRRRTHCQEAQCGSGSGGNAKLYWQTKFNAARGGFFIEISAQVLIGIKIGWVEIGKWVSVFSWRHDR